MDIPVFEPPSVSISPTPALPPIEDLEEL